MNNSTCKITLFLHYLHSFSFIVNSRDVLKRLLFYKIYHCRYNILYSEIVFVHIFTKNSIENMKIEFYSNNQ